MSASKKGKAYEFNFDGLVGPTHNYAGLSHGNVASTGNANLVAKPKEAALQGLQKMKALHDLGLKQGVIAPMERPDVFTLRKLGFTGTDAQVIIKAAKQAPKVLAACSSASSMWTANACTMAPSSDTADAKVHFTPANLSNKFHRSIEHPTTGRILKAMFNDENYFAHHPALPNGDHFGDEGAANHTRFVDVNANKGYGKKGVHFFVYGKYAFDASKPAPHKFPARQTFEASQAVARLHGLDIDNVVYAQQTPNVIDKGVFHNDVISVGNGNVLFAHQKAFVNQMQVYTDLERAFDGEEFHVVEVGASDVPVEDAVKSYLFNSQLVTLPTGDMALICPGECEAIPSVKEYLDWLVEQDTPIKEVKIYDVKQSMQNGGGPACLRQRIVLNETEVSAMNQNVIMSDDLFNSLNTWVEKHYRESLTEDDLADPSLLTESRTALDELTQTLHLGSVYQFQRV
ncbi:N-succinylarginine dihydrolase [Kangiella sp. HZ709]|uniref:N-succinylarginine dihydrolase n=1 Tax=Kangiella sp. HZ709 TaxID=2666328 RepID=UPI0012AFE021|nr:N-succinylarginine dihydrolase [Kangiella sp. HZ709]MRX28455.1 N-succinylarginine dihydrolase [Kangiella sp. HZ709]